VSVDEPAEITVDTFPGHRLAAMCSPLRRRGLQFALLRPTTPPAISEGGSADAIKIVNRRTPTASSTGCARHVRVARVDTRPRDRR